MACRRAHGATGGATQEGPFAWSRGALSRPHGARGRGSGRRPAASLGAQVGGRSTRRGAHHARRRSRAPSSPAANHVERRPSRDCETHAPRLATTWSAAKTAVAGPGESKKARRALEAGSQSPAAARDSARQQERRLAWRGVMAGRCLHGRAPFRWLMAASHAPCRSKYLARFVPVRRGVWGELDWEIHSEASKDP